MATLSKATSSGDLRGCDGLATPRLGNGYDGIYISGAPNTRIGGTTTAARNVIGFNGPGCTSTARHGIYINSSGAQGNLVEGNYIGVTPLGASAGNCVDGVRINGASNNIVGGSAAGAGNRIWYQCHGCGG